MLLHKVNLFAILEQKRPLLVINSIITKLL